MFGALVDGRVHSQRKAVLMALVPSPMHLPHHKESSACHCVTEQLQPLVTGRSSGRASMPSQFTAMITMPSSRLCRLSVGAAHG